MSRPERYAVAVDLGGTWLRAGLVSPAGELLASRRIATPADGRPGPVLDAIAELTRQLIAGRAPADALVGLGVAAPGPLDPATGVVYSPPNLADWGAFPLVDELQARLRLPVWAHNDANLAALGEAHRGAGRGTKVLVYLTVSTGVGGGIVLDGRIFEGAAGLAGELGHVIVAADSPWHCNAGHRGCLEALASGTAIAHRAAVAARPSNGEWTARAVAERALAGEAWAAALFAAAGRALGLAIGSFVNVLDPGRVVLGGGLMAAADLWLPDLHAALAEVVMVPERRAVTVARAALGDDAGLVGAGIHAFACAERDQGRKQAGRTQAGR
jgi:glucokinase